jgi:hypothetical protein
MKYLVVALLFIMLPFNSARAVWQSYLDNGSVAASFDIASFAPVNGNPSVWVRWQNAAPQNGVAGRKLQFTADCTSGKLFEISVIPYDADGNYGAENRHYDTPVEYPVDPGSLNKATYDLLCR